MKYTSMACSLGCSSRLGEAQYCQYFIKESSEHFVALSCFRCKNWKGKTRGSNGSNLARILSYKCEIILKYKSVYKIREVLQKLYYEKFMWQGGVHLAKVVAGPGHNEPLRLALEIIRSMCRRF